MAASRQPNCPHRGIGMGAGGCGPIAAEDSSDLVVRQRRVAAAVFDDDQRRETV